MVRRYYKWEFKIVKTFILLMPQSSLFLDAQLDRSIRQMIVKENMIWFIFLLYISRLSLLPKSFCQVPYAVENFLRFLYLHPRPRRYHQQSSVVACIWRTDCFDVWWGLWLSLTPRWRSSSKSFFKYPVYPIISLHQVVQGFVILDELHKLIVLGYILISVIFDLLVDRQQFIRISCGNLGLKEPGQFGKPLFHGNRGLYGLIDSDLHITGFLARDWASKSL